MDSIGGLVPEESITFKAEDRFLLDVGAVSDLICRKAKLVDQMTS